MDTQHLSFYYEADCVSGRGNRCHPQLSAPPFTHACLTLIFGDIRCPLALGPAWVSGILMVSLIGQTACFASGT